jgi:hypothetical protein
MLQVEVRSYDVRYGQPRQGSGQRQPLGPGVVEARGFGTDAAHAVVEEAEDAGV